jgi:ubiquinone/menaquinone biosynthesis C-methylase UbiE
MKDNFSAQAKLYASFRPRYPQAAYDFIFEQVQHFDTALDCATGNGQAAVVLATRFKQVYATDISEKQLAQAPALPNVTYKVEAAEQTGFEASSFDLVTVAQAIHWFNFPVFYAEVNRLLKPGGVIAIIGYGLIRINEAVDKWIDHYYWNIVGPYWDKERKYVDEEYKTIPFPFSEIPSPQLFIEYNWTKAQCVGYLHTWSAMQHYVKTNNASPLTDALLADLDGVWRDDEVLAIRFPLFLRVGKK